ncbi:hypothetical protein P3T40_002701 [Paraburkholderia sp. EB58]|jgi:hypothetical protein
MQVSICIKSTRPARLIWDRDNMNDSQVEPGAPVDVDAPGGVIGLRALL